MKICMIAEGCYPYVVGGVSGWIQMMITGLKEHDFQIYTIGADSEQRGQFKYEIPPNLTKIYENFLLDSSNIVAKKNMPRIPKDQVEPLRKLIKSDLDTPWKQVFEIIHSNNFDTQAYLGSYDFFDAAKERYERDNVSTGFSDYLWTLRSMFMPLFCLLEKDIPEADVYHSVATGYAGIIGSLGSVLYNKPFILSEHGIYTREREEELIRSKWTKGYFKEMWIQHFYSLSLFAYKQADVVVSLFEKNADIQEDLGCSGDKIQIIANGVSPEDFGIPDNLEKKDGETINIGAIVRVTPIKDIKTMIASFKEVQHKMPDAHFYILGPFDEDPDYYMECAELIEQLDLKNCEMPGRVNVKEYLPNMDIMVLTSISEGQPLVILEGMMYKKPWITTNVGSCSELMNGMQDDKLGAAGLVSPIMDVHSISKNILKLANNEQMRADMGEIGYQRAIKYYRKEDMFKGYRNIYDSFGVEDINNSTNEPTPETVQNDTETQVQQDVKHESNIEKTNNETEKINVKDNSDQKKSSTKTTTKSKDNRKKDLDRLKKNNKPTQRKNNISDKTKQTNQSDKSQNTEKITFVDMQQLISEMEQENNEKNNNIDLEDK